MTHPTSVLHFRFEELTAKQDFVKDAALDETIRARFGDTLTATRFWGAAAARRSWRF